MDINQIKDVNQLKAMAYDQIIAQQQATQNLQIIEQRIQQVKIMPPETSE